MTGFRKVDVGVDNEGNLKISEGGRYRDFPKKGELRLVNLGSFGEEIRGTEIVYPPVEDEIVLAVLISEGTGSGRGAIVFGTEEQFEQVVSEQNYQFGLAAVAAETEMFDSFGLIYEQGRGRLVPTSEPIRVGLYIASRFLPIVTDWQAEYEYPPGSTIVALADQGGDTGIVPTVYGTVAGGISGETEPEEWTINPVETEDGTVTWADLDFLDGIVSCTAKALVASS